MPDDLPRILVVDDDRDIAEVIRIYLSAEGYPVAVAHDGVEAHVFEMSEGPKEKGEDMRLFYWDASKPLPSIQPGEMLRVISHGGFVIDWERV